MEWGRKAVFAWRAPVEVRPFHSHFGDVRNGMPWRQFKSRRLSFAPKKNSV
jgi:hypothetical protein